MGGLLRAGALALVALVLLGCGAGPGGVPEAAVPPGAGEAAGAAGEDAVALDAAAEVTPEPAGDPPAADDSPEADEGAVPAYGVSAGHPAAVEAGMAVLAAGGNAVDAAIATAYAVGVADRSAPASAAAAPRWWSRATGSGRPTTTATS